MDLTTHWRRAYENKYLGAWDLYDSKASRYREVRARIDRVSDDEVIGEGGRRTNPVQLYLSGAKGPIATPMIISKGNGTTLELMFGPSPKDWVGKEITLYVKINKRVAKGTGNVLTIRNTRGGRQLAEEIQQRKGPAIPDEEFTDDQEQEGRQPGDD